jgi:hypothetical protein
VAVNILTAFFMRVKQILFLLNLFKVDTKIFSLLTTRAYAGILILNKGVTMAERISKKEQRESEQKSF